MKISSCPSPARGSSVQQDWRAWLPEDKAIVFRQYEKNLETLYIMFSVALNEALEMKRAGCLPKARQMLGMTAELCTLLTAPLAGMLRALYDHAKHYGMVPSAAPLDAANFRGSKGQHSARMSGLLNRVLFSQRVQFLHKVSTVLEIVENSDTDFRTVALELVDGLSTDPESAWAEVVADHYDINTCLREMLILLKSFLVALPASQLSAFQRAVGELSEAPNPTLVAPQPAVRHRRIAAFAGE
jgi:hypothetical protein